MSGLLDFLKSVLRLFIDNFPRFIEKLFDKIPSGVKKEVGFIVDVVNIIKNMVGSPLADVLTSMTESQTDDKIKEWIRKHGDEVLNGLKIIQNGKVEFSSDEKIRAGQLLMLSSVLNAKYTEMPVDQAAITSAVVYRANAQQTA